jgi:hypothetical protein
MTEGTAPATSHLPPEFRMVRNRSTEVRYQNQHTIFIVSYRGISGTDLNDLANFVFEFQPALLTATSKQQPLILTSFDHGIEALVPYDNHQSCKYISIPALPQTAALIQKLTPHVISDKAILTVQIARTCGNNFLAKVIRKQGQDLNHQ